MIDNSNYTYPKDKSFFSDDLELGGSRGTGSLNHSEDCDCSNIESMLLFVVELKAQCNAIQRSLAIILQRIKVLSDDVRDLKLQVRHSK